MITFYWIAVVLFTAYVFTTIALFNKIPKSISDTYYQWKEAGVGMIFTIVMWVVGLSILIYWVSAAELYKCQFLAFTSISGMLFVGGACAFKETLTKATHFTSAGIWAASAIAFFIVNELYLPLIFGFAFGLLGLSLNNFKNLTFWAEIACVMAMVVGIGLL